MLKEFYMLLNLRMPGMDKKHLNVTANMLSCESSLILKLPFYSVSVRDVTLMNHEL